MNKSILTAILIVFLIGFVFASTGLENANDLTKTLFFVAGALLIFVILLLVYLFIRKILDR